MKEIIIKVENPSASEKDNINTWSPADIVNTVIGVAVIGGSIGAVSFLVYKIRGLEIGRNLILNNLGDIARWMVTTQEGMSGIASALAVGSVAGPNAALGAGLNVPVLVNVANRAPAPEGVPEVVNMLDAAASTPTFEAAIAWDVYQATGSVPASAAAALTANGLRRVGGVNNIYRRTSAMARSAQNTASSMRQTVVNGWNSMTGRGIKVADLEPLEREYHLMEDEREWLGDFLKDGERRQNMTSYEERYEERPTKRPKPNDEEKYGDDEEMPSLVEENAFPKVNASQSAVYNNEPYYEHAESSYALTESKYAPMAEELDTIEMSSWATSSLSPLGESPEQAAARNAQYKEWNEEMDKKFNNEVKEELDRVNAEHKANARDKKFDQDALERKANETKESIDKEQNALNQKLKDINKKFNDERKAKLSINKDNDYKPLPAEEPQLLTAADAADLGVAGDAAAVEAGADAVMAGADGAAAVGEGANAAVTAFRSFLAVAGPVLDVAGTVLNVLGAIAMLVQIGFAIYTAIEDPIIRKKMQASLEAEELKYHKKLQELLDKANIPTLPSHTYTYLSHQSPGFIWSKPSTNASATIPWLYDYPQPVMQYIQARLDHPNIVSPSILEGIMHVRDIYNGWIPTAVLRTSPEYSGLENVNLYDFHLTLYDMVDHHDGDNTTYFEVHGHDARAKYYGSYLKSFEYVMKLIVDKNWKPMLAEIDQYLLTHKSLAKSGEVTLSSVIMRYIVHPSYLQEPTKNSMVKRRYDFLKAVLSMFGDVMVNLIQHEFTTFSNTHDPATHVTGKNTSLIFSDHGIAPVHRTLHRYGQTIPVNDTILGNFRLPYAATESQFPDLADMMDFTWKTSTLFAYESYQVVQGVTVAFGYDPVSKDEYCVMGLGTASSVLCGRLDSKNLVHVTEYQANNDFQTRSEKLHPICDAEKTFLTNTTTPITVDEIDVQSSRYIVSMEGDTMEVKEVDKNRAFQVNVTNSKIDFIALINEKRQCFAAAPASSPPRPTPRPVIPAGITPESSPPRPSVRPSTPRPVITTNTTVITTYPPTPAPRGRRRRHGITTQEVYDELLTAAILDTISKRTHHISSYDDYDALMARVTSKLTFFDTPRNAVDMEYDVGDENDHLDFAWGKDGVVRAYYLGQHSVKVIQMVKASKETVQQEPGWFSSTEWRQSLLVAEFRKDDLAGSNTHVTGKIITVDDRTSNVIGVFDMDVDKGMWYNIVNGLAWTLDSVATGASAVGGGLGEAGGVLGDSFVANAAAAGNGLDTTGRAVGGGIVVVGGVVGEGLSTVGSAVGSGLGSAIGGTVNFFGDIAYDMALNAFYQSGYIQAAATVAVVLVLIDLKKNKII